MSRQGKEDRLGMHGQRRHSNAEFTKYGEKDVKREQNTTQENRKKATLRLPKK